MWWVAGWAVVAIVGVCGLVASTNSVRFERRVAREVAEMEIASEAPVLERSRLTALPAPVHRYLAKALGARQSAIRTVRLRHGGTFRASLTGSWFRIRGEQHFSADPPGFIWWGRIRMFPGMWIDARDRSVNGAGSMFVTAESTFTIADSHGPYLDQGALVRLLAEMAWLPTAFLDTRYVRWVGVDDHRATATLQVNGVTATGLFEFGADDLPSMFSAERSFDTGDGKPVMTPFLGRFADYRPVDQVLVPYHAVAAWIIEGTPQEYVRFGVERLEFDVR